PREPKPSEAAIVWFVRLRSGEATEEDRRRFAAWRTANPENHRAYAEIERLWGEIREVLPGLAEGGGTLASATNRSPSLRQTYRRHGRLAACAAILLVTLAALLHALHFTDPWLSDYHTASGEQRRVRLADGSTVLLNTDTALSLADTATTRRVVLDRGQARFTVAPDPRRPFEVVAGTVTVRALGTVFEVYRVSGVETRVMVQERAVEIRLDGTTGAGAKTARREIAAGQAMAYRAGEPLGRPQAVDLARATAWQSGRLLLNDQRLAEAIAELNRYRRGAILITDGLLASLRVTGVFPLNDPEEALHAIETGLGLRTTRLSPWIVLLHR
ncbi:MAG: FecR family protein, partial [Gammaproteobacteria bacterium]